MVDYSQHRVTSLSGLMLPDPPLGFDTDITLMRNVPINPLGLYENGMEYMYLLAYTFSWTHTRGGSGLDDFHVPLSGVRIRFNNTKGLLENGHIVLALYRSLIAVVETNAYCSLTTDLLLQGQKVGWLQILPASSGPKFNALNNSVTSVTPTYGTLTSSGRIIDGTDRKFVVDYQYDGARIDSRDIWTAVLGSMVETAYNGANTTFSHIDAVSANANAVYHIHATAGSVLCKYWYAAQAMRLMFIKMMSLKEFEGVDLNIYYNGVVVAEGWLLKMNRAQINGTDVVGVA